MSFKIENEREVDGRWIAEIPSLPGVLAYGKTRNQAIAAVEALALRVIAERIEHANKPA
jgi:predicted RNase H-like HicB family nuclease